MSSVSPRSKKKLHSVGTFDSVANDNILNNIDLKTPEKTIERLSEQQNQQNPSKLLLPEDVKQMNSLHKSKSYGFKGSDIEQENEQIKQAYVNCSVMNPKEGEAVMDEGEGSLGAFELCSFALEGYPNEQITYVKFLDDNDPSLLLLVTYDKPSQTSYMKVLKIQEVVDKSKQSGGLADSNRISSQKILGMKRSNTVGG